jgi:3-oxoacyl-[acyl-carrier protein] reductase
MVRHPRLDTVDHRVALVTGAASRGGIGFAIAERLRADGLQVVVHGLPGEGGEVEADFADPGAPARVAAAVREAHGRLDVVVANHARSSDVALDDLTAEEIDATLAVNVRASMLLAREVPRAAGGRLVLFTSGQHHGGMPAELPYVASKAALHGLTKSLALALVPATVNTIDPGPTDTGYADDARLDAVAAALPRGRWGKPEEAARLVAWLVSEDADWVTGQVISSDGGWSSR